MDHSTNDNRESEVMQGGMEDQEDVGVAYTTNDEVVTSAADFDQQYQQQQQQQQQQAYQQSMQREQQNNQSQLEEQQQQSRRPRIITALEGVPPTASASASASGSNSINQSQVSLAPPSSLLPTQNRVFGLTKDLAGPSADSAHLNISARPQRLQRKSSQSSLASTVDSPSLPSPYRSGHQPVASGSNSSSSGNARNHPSKSNEGPQFSVEVVAPAFDKRGYPVFSGRAARICGYLRTRPVDGCEILIKLSAGTTQGKLVNVWDGEPLMPHDQNDEKRVFATEDRIQLKQNMAQLRPGAHPSSTDRDDYIYTTPFEIMLPVGVSTRSVNGEVTTTAVALPPSYEMSSENDAKERESAKANNLLRSSGTSIKSKSSRMTNFNNSMGGIGTSFREAMEKNLGEVYRIGCFYKIVFTLQTIPSPPTTPVKSIWGKRKKKDAIGSVLDEITIPFIFTGEPTSLPPPPHSIPLSLVGPVLLKPNTNLGPQWDCERNQAKWSGNIFRSAKRTVDLEMHMPSPACLQAPSVFPIILIIRPADPLLLASIPSSEHGSPLSADTETVHGSTRYNRSSQSGFSRGSRPSQDKDISTRNGNTMQDSDGMLSKLMRTSLALGRKASNVNMNSSSSMSTLPPLPEPSSSNNSIRESLASTFSRRRPNTAPPSGSSSTESPGATSVIGSGGQYMGNLSGLVRVSLLQTTYCSGAGPHEVPKSRRKLISEAEMEEVDITTILGEIGKVDSVGDRGDDATITANQVLIQNVQSKGIRVVRGLIRVGTDATPSFRCQGIEVKYAIKVDLVPFSKRNQKRPNSGGSTVNGNFVLGDNMSMQSRPSMTIPSSPSLNHANSSSPPMPPFPAEHRHSQFSTSSTVTPGNAQQLSASHQHHLHQLNNSTQPNYSPSVALGLGVGGTSTIVTDSDITTSKLEKGVGALWADVRMVRSGFAT